MIDEARFIDRLESFGVMLPAIVAGFSLDDLRWKPADGAWSILEIVRHLLDEEVLDFRKRLRQTIVAPDQPWPEIMGHLLASAMLVETGVIIDNGLMVIVSWLGGFLNRLECVRNLKRVLSGVFAVAMLLPAVSASAQTTLPSKALATWPAMKLGVLPTGEIRISAGEKLLASGQWRLNPDLQKLDADQIAIGDLVKSVMENDGDAHATIHNTFSNAQSVTDIRFEGEDLHLRVHLQNLDASRTMGSVVMHGLTFHFARNPSGAIPSWHYTYLLAKGLSIFHPSLAQPVGAVFARDDDFGFSAFSASEFDRRSLFNAQWQKEGVVPSECEINFFNTEVIQAGQAVDVDVNFRISRDTSIPHLFEPYKKVYAEHFPALLYKPDSRPVAQFAAVGKNLVSPTNPLGYGGPARRLDSAAGTGAYVRALAPVLENANALGIIFWSPGGYSEPMYPPDFDQFPKSVQQQIPTLVEGFKKHGLRVGLCARCGDGVTRNGKQFEIFRLNADDADQMRTLLDRFQRSIDMGFDMFYLDSFGADDPNDQKILEKIRTKVGKDVLLYTEFCTDLSLPYAGHYCEWRGTYILWTNDEQYAALRYLCPDSTWLDDVANQATGARRICEIGFDAPGGRLVRGVAADDSTCALIGLDAYPPIRLICWLP